MREKNCPICSNSNTEKVCELNENNQNAFSDFSKLKYQGCLDEIVNSGVHPEIWHCKNCDFYYYYQVPTDAQLGKMYASGTFLFDQAVRVGVENKKAANLTILLKKSIELVEPTKKLEETTLLDFGSGAGMLAKIAVNLGLKVTAYEPSLERNTVDKGDKLTFTNDLGSLDTRNFDIIVMNQVMEHVKQPVDTLRKLGSLSHQNTLIYVAVPNIKNSLRNPEMWSEWPFNGKNVHIMAPFEHLNGFTPRAFKRAASFAGLKPVSLKRKFSFSPRFALIDSLFGLTGIGGTARGIFRIK